MALLEFKLFCCKNIFLTYFMPIFLQVIIFIYVLIVENGYMKC